MLAAPAAIRAIRKKDPHGSFPARYDLSALRYLFLVGERLDPETYRWATDLLGVPVIDHWWQTETGWPVVANPAGIELLPVKPGSPGRPLPGWDVRILTEDGAPAPVGEDGAIVLKLPMPPGALLTLWNDDERFVRSYLSTFPGFYLTGDGGHLDGDGYLYVTGRTDDVINVAGNQLSPGGMEDVLAAHPDVADCAVFGVADAMKGQVPRGLVVLHSGVPTDGAYRARLCAELVQLVRDQIGAVTGIRQVDVVAALPRTRSGKILRKDHEQHRGRRRPGRSRHHRGRLGAGRSPPGTAPGTGPRLARFPPEAVRAVTGTREGSGTARPRPVRWVMRKNKRRRRREKPSKAIPVRAFDRQTRGQALFGQVSGREQRRLGAALQSQLGQHAGDVVLDGLLGQEHGFGDSPVRHPLADQREHPPFLVGERGKGRIGYGAPPDSFDHPSGDRRVEQRLTGGHPPDGVDEVGAADLLEHVPGGAGHDRGEQRLVVVEGGQDQRGDVGVAGPDLPADVDAGAVRQPAVQHRDLGLQGQDLRLRVGGRPGLTDDLDVALALEQVFQPEPDDLVIVQEVDGDLLGRRPGRRSTHFSPSLSLPDRRVRRPFRTAGGSVQPGAAFPFACRGAVDPVHSISLLIMTLALFVPAEADR